MGSTPRWVQCCPDVLPGYLWLTSALGLCRGCPLRHCKKSDRCVGGMEAIYSTQSHLGHGTL